MNQCGLPGELAVHTAGKSYVNKVPNQKRHNSPSGVLWRLLILVLIKKQF